MEHKVDICFITETWISKNEDLRYIKANLKMPGYHILSCERENQKGGGLVCIYNENLKVKAPKSQKYESFELLTVQVNIKSKTNIFSLIDRPPSSTKNEIPIRVFLDEFTEHITTILQQHDDPIILGDINIPWNRADNMDRESLVEIMSLYNLKQNVNIQTHKQGNTLDWIMSKENSTTISEINEGDYFSDHCVITWTHRVEKQPMEKIVHTSRDLESINEQDFASDLADRLPTPGTTDNLQTLYEEYTKAITSTLDQHAPEVTQKRTKRPTKSWYDKDAQKLKRQRRVAEKNGLRTKSDLDREHYLHLDKIYKKHLYHKKKAHITNMLDKNKNKLGALYKILRSFAEPKDNNPLPDINKEKLPDEFANYFLNKIEKIMDVFEGNDKYSPPIRPCTKLQKFKPLTEQQALNVINQMHYTTCEMDPCNTKFLMKFKDTLIGTITKIINISLTTGQYLDEWKVAVVRPLIKGPNLDMEYKNYCPISNLSFMAKLIEKAAQIQLMAHFTEHNLLPKHQNAYRKYFSTETAILNICDNIWTNMENSKLTSIICLDLNAAFDTVNHSILLEVMRNYFAIADMALDWISHYLRNRKFSVHIDSFSSNTKTINFSVPQGSILGPTLSIAMSVP